MYVTTVDTAASTSDMASRIHREVYVRFGGEYPKIRHRNMKMDVGCLAYIMSTVGNVFSGQVVGETAKTLSERFGKILQKRESMSINRNDTSTSISTQLDSLIPASKISTLSQGMFVGAVADNFGETIEQKIFHAQIVVDNDAVQKEMAAYQPIPEISSFLDENGNDTMEQQIQANYRQIKQDIVELVENELIRIENDPELKHLLGGDEGVQTTS